MMEDDVRGFEAAGGIYSDEDDVDDEEEEDEEVGNHDAELACVASDQVASSDGL